MANDPRRVTQFHCRHESVETFDRETVAHLLARPGNYRAWSVPGPTLSVGSAGADVWPYRVNFKGAEPGLADAGCPVVIRKCSARRNRPCSVDASLNADLDRSLRMLPLGLLDMNWQDAEPPGIHFEQANGSSSRFHDVHAPAIMRPCSYIRGGIRTFAAGARRPWNAAAADIRRVHS